MLDGWLAGILASEVVGEIIIEGLRGKRCIFYSQTRKLVILKKCLKIQSFPSNSCFDRAFPGMPKTISHCQRMTEIDSQAFPRNGYF